MRQASMGNGATGANKPHRQLVQDSIEFNRQSKFDHLNRNYRQGDRAPPVADLREAREARRAGEEEEPLRRRHARS